MEESAVLCERLCVCLCSLPGAPSESAAGKRDGWEGRKKRWLSVAVVAAVDDCVCVVCVAVSADGD